jgi:hypothetical protein
MSGCLLTRDDTARGPHTEILCKRMSWIVAASNGEATLLGGEDVNLIGALPHEASEAFDSVGRLNVTMHHLRKCIKCQQMLLVFSQTAYRFWIALSILGECSQPIGSMPPAASVAPKYPPVRPGHSRALVWG